MSRHIDSIQRDAIAEGILSAAAIKSARTSRPWPVVVMTAIAAWFAAIPLGACLVLAFLSNSPGGAGLVVLGAIVLIASIAVLRIPGMPLFLEQLAVPGLIIGVGLVGGGIYEHGSRQTAFGILAAVTFALAMAVPQNWLRALLGAAAVNLLAISWTRPLHFGELPTISPWLAWHIIGGAWLAGHAVLNATARNAGLVAVTTALEAILGGIGTMIPMALAYFSGETFLIGAPFDLGKLVGNNYLSAEPVLGIEKQISAACAIAAHCWLAYRWPDLRRWWFAAIAAIAMLISWYGQSLGLVLLLMAVCLSSGRRNLAILAGVSALWMVGGFYYQLYWPLLYKALLLLGCATGLGAIARFALPVEPGKIKPAAPVPMRDDRWKRWVFASGGALVLVIANAAIWQKEKLIREGDAVFVELAPVDPRSLMQGDYMALAFLLPNELFHASSGTTAVARRGANGVVELIGANEGKALAKGDILIELVRKNGRTVIVTDAWFFGEGEAERWSKAKYGEFRVAADGRALLVGLRGPNREKL